MSFLFPCILAQKPKKSLTPPSWLWPIQKLFSHSSAAEKKFSFSPIVPSFAYYTRKKTVRLKKSWTNAGEKWFVEGGGRLFDFFSVKGFSPVLPPPMFAPAAHISVLIRDGGPKKPSILAIPKSLVRDGMFIETLLHFWEVWFLILEGPRFFLRSLKWKVDKVLWTPS